MDWAITTAFFRKIEIPSAFWNSTVAVCLKLDFHIICLERKNDAGKLYTGAYRHKKTLEISQTIRPQETAAAIDRASAAL